MSTSGKEGDDDTSYTWGEEKPKGNYKSVNIRGEVYEVGHCVQCNLESKASFIWKILKLFQVGDRKMCRIRRLFSEPELPPNVKGLDPPGEPKELFLASLGADVQEDIPLGEIGRRYTIFCTFQDDDMLNPIPSSEQINKADYFFYRGYDPVSEEVVALDGLVDELGAQYVYNKSWWLGDNVARRSSSQISASRIHSQSPASGSSAHQGAAKGMCSSAPEASPAPSRDSTERKVKKRKSHNLGPMQPKGGAVDEKKNESHAPKKRRLSKGAVSRSDHVVFALPAPAMINAIRKQGVKPPVATPKPLQGEAKPRPVEPSPTAPGSVKPAESSGEKKRKAGAVRSEGAVKKTAKAGVSLSAPSAKKLLKGADEGGTSKQAVAKDGGGGGERQGKAGEKPSEGVKSLVKPGDRPSASSGLPSQIQKRADEENASHVPRKAPTSNKVKDLNVEIPSAELPSAPGASLLVKTAVASRMPNRDDDIVHAPSTSQRRPGSPSFVEKKETVKGATRPTLSPRAMLSNSLSDRDADITNFSPAASPQKPHGQIFKPIIEDWDTTIAKAIQSNRVLLLKNVDPELHSEDLAEALTEHMKTKIEVRIVPPVSFSYRTTMALLKLPSVKKAQEFLKVLESSDLLVANRVVTAFAFSHEEFKGKHSLKYPGHLEFSQVRDYHVEDYRNAVATSHLAQGNTIEFAYGLPWRVLDEQHEDQWRMLQEEHSKVNHPKAGLH